jgi:uncharacterized protein (DUF2384 family)
MAQVLADSVGLRKADIIAHATESLDGRKNALDWLQKPSPSMGGRTPLEVLDQGEPEELQQLDDVLTALDYGMHT